MELLLLRPNWKSWQASFFMYYRWQCRFFNLETQSCHKINTRHWSGLITRCVYSWSCYYCVWKCVKKWFIHLNFPRQDIRASKINTRYWSEPTTRCASSYWYGTRYDRFLRLGILNSNVTNKTTNVSFYCKLNHQCIILLQIKAPMYHSTPKMLPLHTSTTPSLKSNTLQFL